MIPITSTLCRSFRGPPAYGRTGTWCFIEWNEWLMVSTLVTPAHSVIELGARYGTTSCMLAAATNNSGRVVAVEPAKNVLTNLNDNRDAHCCRFHILSGTVSTIPLAMHGSSKGYNQRTMSANATSHKRTPGVQMLENFAVTDVEAATGSRINAALIDCEGCIEAVLGAGDEVSPLLERLELLLIEEDRPDLANYDAVHAKLRRLGFRNVWCAREVPLGDAPLEGRRADTSIGERIKHTGWQRGDLPARPTCDQALSRLALTHQPPMQCLSAMECGGS